MIRSVHLDTQACPADAARSLQRIIRRRLLARCGVQVNPNPPADLALEFRVDPSLETEEFSIYDGEPGCLLLQAGSPLGLLYAAGKFLRTASYRNDGISPATWRGNEKPVKPVRGIYFATHFMNYYHTAPLAEIEAYLEDLCLWGFNALAVWFDMHHFESIEDARAREMLHRLHCMLSTAHRLGWMTGLLGLANEAYHSSPNHLRADWTSGHDGYFADVPSYHVELCPSKPAANDLLLAWRKEVFSFFEDIPLRFFITWPYDQGGCSCQDCAPWGGNGYLKISRHLAEMAKNLFPGIQTIISTWYFNRFVAGEWEGFARSVANDPSWVDYILADYPAKFPDFIINHGVPANLPLLGFPEISMYQSEPWGGFGANPLPRYLQQSWEEIKHLVCGGFPYSEGIFEDLNKSIVAHFYWTGKSNPLDTIREYVNLEFSTPLQDKITRAITLLENGNHRERYQNGVPQWMPEETDDPVGEQFIIQHPANVAEVARSFQEADSELHPATRSSWRWRILYLRSIIDGELVKTEGRSNAILEEAYQELIRIYHAERAIWAVKPPAREHRNLSW